MAREMTEREREVYQSYYDDALGEPLAYFRHDTDAHRDTAIRRLVMEHGKGAGYDYWVLAECLASAEGHAYRVSDESGWQMLALDMSACGCAMSVDECREFVGTLAGYGLVCADLLFDCGKVTIERTSREADRWATAKASKQLAAWRTNDAKRKR